MKKFIFSAVCAFALAFGVASCSNKTANENDSADTVEVTQNDSVDTLEVDTVCNDSVAL